MAQNLHALAVETFVPMLGNLSAILCKATEYARDKKIDPAVLVGARLAPDMFPLSLQVELACFHAANAAALLTGGEAPELPISKEPPKTFEALVARIARAVEGLTGVAKSKFEGAGERAIAFEIPIADLRFKSTGLELLRDWALPHFYFHIVTAYDILRHNGLEIGKREYLAHVGRYMRPSAG